MVKALNTLPSLSHLDESYAMKKERFFNITNDNDRDLVVNLSGNTYRIYFVIFRKENDDKKIPEKIYLGECQKACAAEYGPSLKCLIQHKTENKAIIDNFMSCSEIDLDEDFEQGSYVTIETSLSLIKQMDLIVNPPYAISQNVLRSFGPLYEEEELHVLAQRNEYCIREYGIAAPQTNRGEFQRDYERITHSKAFRRMVDKAQIFSADKGDHYRTRMTHTLAVCQIARGLSKELNLNSFLTEAIALGHDLGHTPFGHQGERTLNSILKGEKPIIKQNIEGNADINYGGFKHNYHSLRVASHLEEEYIEFNGLDLSYQTLDGMWKHTKTKVNEYSLEAFIFSSELRKYLLRNNEIPLSLEGQVVRIADEIAQRSHDLEDAFSAKRLSISQLYDYLSLRKMSNLKSQIENIETSLKNLEDRHRIFVDKDELMQSRISAQIIQYFILDVVKQSNINIDRYLTDGGEAEFRKSGYIIDKSLIDFSSSGKKLCNYLERIITKKVINSSEVSLFDSNGESIIESLFHSYYNNPRLLHKGTLRRIMRDFRSISSNVIDFEDADPEVIKKEWEKIIKAKPGSDKDIAENEYLEKNKILVRNIVDFIAGMTDSYAICEYNKIARS
ncbi:putative dGTPase [Desulfitobacterium hafniense DP7]|uniref:Putative dGTPase n=2 Tax=Desulfitobacterium hafniense TaxID=49338 RepID=G9XPY8_DESHA|nr:putative dGTPase [Desulfitobacterium hafniense DP7]